MSKTGGSSGFVTGESIDPNDKEEAMFGNVFGDAMVDHSITDIADDVLDAGFIESNTPNPTTDKAGGIFSGDVVTIKSGQTLNLDMGLIIFASEKIEIEAGATIDGFGEGVPGSTNPVTTAEVTGKEQVHMNVSSARTVNPSWFGRPDKSYNSDDDDGNEGNGNGGLWDVLPDWKDVVGIMGATTTSSATLPNTMSTQTTIAAGVFDGLLGENETVDDIDDARLKNGSVKVRAKDAIPANANVSVDSIDADETLSISQRGMFGEHDLFENIGVDEGWLTQAFLYTIMKTHFSNGLYDSPPIKGGRGGAAGVIDETDLDGTDYTASDWNGGDGGAALILIAPEVIIRAKDRNNINSPSEQTQINLLGSVPPALDSTNRPDSFGGVLPERGRSGKFGVVCNSMKIENQDVVRSHAESRVAFQGGEKAVTDSEQYN